MSQEVKKNVLLDGRFLRCHGRILENVFGKENLIQFNALSFYGKYTDRLDIDSVPEGERKETARKVADTVLEALKKVPVREMGFPVGCDAVATGVIPESAAVSDCGCSRIKNVYEGPIRKDSQRPVRLIQWDFVKEGLYA